VVKEGEELRREGGGEGRRGKKLDLLMLFCAV
jgi:hypothetical protein